MNESLKAPLLVVAVIALLGVVWFVATRTILKAPPEPPKLKPSVQVRPNMTAEEAGRIFAIPQGTR